MRGYLSNLVRNFRLTNAARPARRKPRRTILQLEGLESRTVMSTTATQAGSALLVNVDPGFTHIIPGHGGIEFIQQVTFQSDPQQAGKLDVLYFGNLLTQPIPIASIQNITVNVAGLDAINVDDSNGFPFAPGTTISLSGSGSVNSLNLTGSGTIGGREFYSAGNGAQSGSLSLVGVTFAFSDAIGSVTDAVRASELLVSTSGASVSLSGSDGVTQTFSGLGSAGGTLTYSNKGLAELDQFAPNAKVSLNATAGAAGEQVFALFMHGANDEAVLSATPSTVLTDVKATDGNVALVNLLTNSGPVSVEGTSLVKVSLGEAAPNGLSTTGIKSNVFIHGVGELVLKDSGNVTTQEHVTVTESTISGTGLFGNDAVTLDYFNTAHVEFRTGQLADTYNVVGSQPGTHFGSKITIEDFSRVGLNVQVALDGGSGLDLDLRNTSLATPAPATLFISASNGTFSDPTPNLPAGTEDVTFAGGLTSKVAYKGFTSVTFSDLHRGV
jgi:hypothetical protein